MTLFEGGEHGVFLLVEGSWLTSTYELSVVYFIVSPTCILV